MRSQQPFDRQPQSELAAVAWPKSCDIVHIPGSPTQSRMNGTRGPSDRRSYIPQARSRLQRPLIIGRYAWTLLLFSLSDTAYLEGIRKGIRMSAALGWPCLTSTSPTLLNDTERSRHHPGVPTAKSNGSASSGLVVLDVIAHRGDPPSKTQNLPVVTLWTTLSVCPLVDNAARCPGPQPHQKQGEWNRNCVTHVIGQFCCPCSRLLKGGQAHPSHYVRPSHYRASALPSPAHV